MEFRQTDLPEPVAPAMSRWGISIKSAMTGSPAISLPRAMARRRDWPEFFGLHDLPEINGGLGLVGYFRPMADLPGIGASILTPVAARLRARSSARLTIRLTLTPAAG